jgi:5-methylcytosine-specific restriction endonuclease McrA
MSGEVIEVDFTSESREFDYNKYVDYITNSPVWYQKRLDCIRRQHGICPGYEIEPCQYTDKLPIALAVHHLTYERLYDELPEDLIALCPTCHALADADRKEWMVKQTEAVN